MTRIYYLIIGLLLLAACKPKPIEESAVVVKDSVVRPVFASGHVNYDTDDPAIWIHPNDPSKSLIIGTDKGGELGDGGLFVFDLKGKLVDSIRPLKRPNNVDVAYGLMLNGKKVDIAVCTERLSKAIRVFTLPDLKSVDKGGIPVFVNEVDSLRDPMGIALYTNPADQKIYAIVGRKTGPTDGSYLWQYLLADDGKGNVKATLVRKFGYYSGKKEIESIAVDNELGFVYHSDEQHGIHKSYAHPDSSSVELALFGTNDFTEDIEGISIYKFDNGTGYILVSDQQANRFNVYPREGANANVHEHRKILSINTSTVESDGSEVVSTALPAFPHGLFVAMSDDKTFQFYTWESLATDSLRMK
jgi:3-phytase